jgi:hypothetical protein
MLTNAVYIPSQWLNLKFWTTRDTRFRLWHNRVSICFVAGLVKGICYLITGRHKPDIKSTKSYFSLKKMKIRLNRFRPRLAVRYVASKLWHQRGALRWGACSSLKSDWIHVTWAAPFAKTLYSASVLDFDIVGCFLRALGNKDSAKEYSNPHVDLQSCTLLAQSTSVNTLSNVDGDLLMMRPMATIPLT